MAVKRHHISQRSRQAGGEGHFASSGLAQHIDPYIIAEAALAGGDYGIYRVDNRTILDVEVEQSPPDIIYEHTPSDIATYDNSVIYAASAWNPPDTFCGHSSGASQCDVA